MCIVGNMNNVLGNLCYKKVNLHTGRMSLTFQYRFHSKISMKILPNAYLIQD